MTFLNAVRHDGDAVTFRIPRAEDGPAVTALIAGCPPLDLNSAYCNLLQCTHFADSCIIAEQQGQVIGWISGYHLPADPTRYFLWQVAVAQLARGKGLAARMIDELLARPAMKGVTRLITTITRENEASWALFHAYARHRIAPVNETLCFDRDTHFSGSHDSEWKVEIGPFARLPKAIRTTNNRQTCSQE